MMDAATLAELNRVIVKCPHGLAFEVLNPDDAPAITVDELVAHYNSQSAPSLTWLVNERRAVTWRCAESHERTVEVIP